MTAQMEDAVLRTIARLDGKPFPTTRGLVRGWVNGRLRRSTAAETVFCAELVAATYTAMGLLPGDRPLQRLRPGQLLVRRRPRAAAGREARAGDPRRRPAVRLIRGTHAGARTR